MRDLTKEEIEEYFQYAKSDRAPSDFHQEQAKLVGEVAVAHGMMDAFEVKVLEMRRAGHSMESVMLSMVVWAFQIGRECESRLLTRALKGR